MASGTNSTAVGDSAVASGENASSFGQGAQATAANSLAVGHNAQATGENAIAIGAGAKATGSVAVGSNSLAANGGTAVGDETVSTGSRSAALGYGARSLHTNATAVGSGAHTTRANQVAIGTQSSTYTMQGLTSSESRAQQSGPTYLVTTDASGNLAASTYSFAKIEKQLDNQSNGIALAMAMGGAFLPDSKNFAISFNAGYYDGREALAANLVARLDNNWFVSGSAGTGTDQNKWGGRAGVTYAW